MLYAWFYPDEVCFAKTQLDFYKSKKKHIEEDKSINDNTKLLKLKRINLVIDCITYSYGLL